MDRDGAQVRLAELVAALSLGVDLGFGQPMEHILRQCVIALRIAERLGLGDQERSGIYYTSLLVGVGCHTDAHEQARWFGDDIKLKASKYAPPIRSAAKTMRMIGSGNPLAHRFRVGLEFVLSGRRELDGMISHHAEMARVLGEQLDLPADVLDALAASYEQWDGKGWPGELAGEDVPLASRIGAFSEQLEVAHRIGGVDAVRKLATKRGGKEFDPSLAELVRRDANEIFGGLDRLQTWDTVIAMEPALEVRLTGDRFDAALEAIANFVDLKSPYFLGHAQGVADLSANAATSLGMSDAEARTIRRAGLVQGIGRLGVSNAILDKRGPLGPGEWERVRMHPYLTERMLHQSASLAPLGAIAVQMRERLDGSGHPRGLVRAAISRPARILGAADAYQAMREPRPYRAALRPDQAASELRAEVVAGRLDADAVEAVLGAAGHRVSRRREGPAGLTSREVDVIRLLARGSSNKEIAAQLHISPKTVANHVEHIYLKIRASTRAAASLFAMEHGLLTEDEAVPA